MNLDDLTLFQQLDGKALLGSLDAMGADFDSAWHTGMIHTQASGQPGRAYQHVIIEDAAPLAPQTLDVITGIYPLKPGRSLVYTSHVPAPSHENVLRIRTVAEGFLVSDNQNTTLWNLPHARDRTDAIGPLLAGYLCILQAAEVLADSTAISAACEECVEELNRGAALLTASVPAMHNPAKRLAGQMMDRLPLLLGSGLSFIIADYWKHRIHQMAKSWAQAEDLSQAYFQKGAGVLFPEFLMQKMHCVFLAPIPGPLNPNLDPIAVYFLQNGLSIDQLAGHGRSALAQALSLIQFADYTSYYLAMAYGVDPASGLLD